MVAHIQRYRRGFRHTCPEVEFGLVYLQAKWQAIIENKAEQGVGAAKHLWLEERPQLFAALL